MEKSEATSEAVTHDEHDSSYTKPVELQQEPDSWVLPNVGFFSRTVQYYSLAGHQGVYCGHTHELEMVYFGSCALRYKKYRWQYHCADMVLISTITSDFRECGEDNCLTVKL